MPETSNQQTLTADIEQIIPVFQQIADIDKNTADILKELQKEKPLETLEPSEFEFKILEYIERQQESTGEPTEVETLSTVPSENIEEDEEEPPIEIIEPVVEEELPEEEPIVEEESSEETIDYMQLIYEENLILNEKIEVLTSEVHQIQRQNDITNHADHIVSSYGLVVLPAIIIIYMLSRLIRPFLP